MDRTPLFLSYDEDLDWLEAGPFGTVMDRQGHDRWRGVNERFGYFLDQPEGSEVGFKVIGFSVFRAEDPELVEIFDEPRFTAPVLGLREATAGEILLAARPFLGGSSTVDREFFNAAMDADGEEALAYWSAALQSGNAMAHYGAGYTLLELGRDYEAYRHLRAYTEHVARDAWAWDYRARACVALGETAEAIACCERALAIEVETGEQTEAQGLLERLLA